MNKYISTVSVLFMACAAHIAAAQTNLTDCACVTTNDAVSEINAKLDYSAGNMDSHIGNLVDASLTVPVGHDFGFQADGLYSRIAQLNFEGGAGHFFWRDPQVGLLGLTGGYLTSEYEDTYQAGAEGEYYLGRCTLGFFGGVGSINYANSVPFIDSNPTRFLGRLSADYYPIDNLRIGASFTTAFKDKLGQGELEYQTPISGLALTANVAYGDYGYHQWLFGVRYYFGGNKSLRDRQRQDDPPGLMGQVLSSLGLYGAEYNHKEDQYVAEHYDDYGPGNTYGSVYNPGEIWGGESTTAYIEPPLVHP